MNPIEDGPLRGRLNVPLYWAKWYHDGRRAISLPNSRAKGPMIYYKNPLNDPRLGGYGPFRYPVTEKTRRRLTSKEISRDRKAGKIVVTYKVGKTEGNPFFSDTGGMQGFDRELDKLAQKETDSYVRAKLAGAGMLDKKIKVTI